MVFLTGRRWRALTLISACLPFATAGEPGAPEYGIKAAYLYRFMNFVEWPPASVSNGAINLCVAGKDPFGHILDSGFQGKKVGAKAIVIRRISEPRTARSCHILFIGGISEKDYRILRKEVQGSPVLSVSDDEVPQTRDAIIVFHIVEGRILFDIRAHTARQSGIEISSQLLKLARSTQ